MHVSVIDVATGATHQDNTVLINGNRITFAGPAAGAKISAGARVIDGRGKFLIPGLWDMHVHGFVYVFSDFAGPLMIANGVTGARDMGYYIDTTLRWKADIAAYDAVHRHILAHEPAAAAKAMTDLLSASQARLLPYTVKP